MKVLRSAESTLEYSPEPVAELSRIPMAVRRMPLPGQIGLAITAGLSLLVALALSARAALARR